MRLLYKMQPQFFSWLFLALCLSPELTADILMIDNGDQLTGEVKRLADKKVFLKTPYAGTIEIDWEMLEGFSSDRDFQVEIERGRRYRGKVVLAEGELKVATAEGTVSLRQDQVIGLVPRAEKGERNLWREVEGNLDVGYNLTRGNSRLNQSSFLADGVYERGDYKISGDASSIFSRQDASDATSRQTVGVRFDWFVNPRVFRFALASFEHNDRQRLNYRTVLGGGLGRTLVKNKRTELSLLGGVTLTGERFRLEEGLDEPPVLRGGEGLVGIEWETLLVDRIEFTNKFTAHPNLSDEEKYRLEYDSTLRLPLTKNLSWSLSFYDRFVSRPPVRVQRNDYGLVSAFGIGF